MRHIGMRQIVCLGVMHGLAAGLWAGPFMGEYEGTFHADKKVALKAVGKVVDEGDNYRIVLCTTPETPIDQGAFVELSGPAGESEMDFSDRAGGYQWQVQIRDGNLTAKSEYGQYFELRKIESKSPNAGAKPPANAVVLLAYEPGRAPEMSAWTNTQWQALEDGCMQITPGKGANRTKQQFGDIQQLHIEFKLPLEPRARGQGRANSGVYLADTYEVQVLDSFGLTHTSGDCGGIYNVARARVNVCLPPEVWQTYDITFRAPRLDENGNMKELPRITVIHNGVKIHDDLEIPMARHRVRGALQLQDHSHPIQYRNIWLVE
jgi:hypothetical protein